MPLRTTPDQGLEVIGRITGDTWVESFHGRLRDEMLNGCQFGSLLEARVLLEDWRTEYNCERPHSALGMLSPTEFAQAWTTRQSQLQLA